MSPHAEPLFSLPMRRSPTSRFCRTGIATLALLCLAMTPPLVAGSVGDEFQINQLTTGDQQLPDLAPTADGGFLVVWQSPVSPGNDSDMAVLGRRLGVAGQALADDFQINTYTTFSQRRPRVASRGDSSFVVVWQGFYPGGKGQLETLEGRAFDSLGNGVTGDFTIAVSPNIYTTINSHDAGAASNGDFVVASSRFFYFNASYSGSATLRRLQDDGTQLGSDSLGNSSGREFSVRVGGDEAQGFVVSTHSREYFGQYSFANAQRLAPDGTLLGSSVDVFADQTSGVGGGFGADATPAADGGFVIAWNGYNPYFGGSSEIYGRSVSSGDVLAAPQVINSYTTGSQNPPRLARAADGTMLAVWESRDSTGDPGLGVRARWLASDGSPMGDEMAVNTYTTGDQGNPEVTASADGSRFLVVWNSAVGAGEDIDGQSIRGRIFGPPGLFVDGFESGSTAGWSSSSP